MSPEENEKSLDNPEHSAPEAPSEPESRYPDLDLLQQDVSRRLRDNQRFLDHFLDDDFMDELDSEDEDVEIDPDDFEEL
jgi:hypothetical protein